MVIKLTDVSTAGAALDVVHPQSRNVRGRKLENTTGKRQPEEI